MAGITTQGSQLRVLDTSASPNAYVDIGCVTDMQGPTGSRQVIDTTCLDSTGREKNVGIPDYGQVSGSLILDTTAGSYHVTDAISMWESFKNGTRQTFRIIIPNSPEDYIEFTAYVLSFQYQASIDSIWTCSFTLEIDGAPTDSF